MHGDKEVVKTKIKQEKITGSWVAVKKKIDGKEGDKARWAARGFQEQREIKADSPIARKLGIRVLFANAASKELPLEAIDVNSAFLQGDQLDRELYMETPSEEKKPNVIWRLNKAVYGLKDASLKWYKRLDKELITLDCVRSKLDTACYIYQREGQLAGIACIYVERMEITPSTIKYYVGTKMPF